MCVNVWNLRFETHNQGVAFEPNWAHSEDQPLTKYFVGGFFLLPGLRQELIA